MQRARSQTRTRMIPLATLRLRLELQLIPSTTRAASSMSKAGSTTTVLYYYRARYYDPIVGRFINEDPKRFSAGLNYYSYVHNRPLTHIDPMGLIDQDESGKIHGDLDDLCSDPETLAEDILALAALIAERGREIKFWNKCKGGADRNHKRRLAEEIEKLNDCKRYMQELEEAKAKEKAETEQPEEKPEQGHSMIDQALGWARQHPVAAVTTVVVVAGTVIVLSGGTAAPVVIVAAF